MKKYKIIFSDIDGTLLNDENQVPKETVEELQSLDKRGIPFVLVSARMPEGMRPIREELGIHAPMVCYSGGLVLGPDDMISSLSGGNQQKVIFGKWLERSPQVFMMDEPTRGIDVGAKYEIYELIIQMAKQGKTIIVVSSEMPEILGITNRIGVMSNGHLSGIENTKETNQEELLRLSAKYL